MANHKTCKHLVVKATFDRNGKSNHLYCASCGEKITDELWLRRNYQYSKKYGTWQHVPVRGVERAQARGDSKH